MTTTTTTTNTTQAHTNVHAEPPYTTDAAVPHTAVVLQPSQSLSPPAQQRGWLSWLFTPRSLSILIAVSSLLGIGSAYYIYTRKYKQTYTRSNRQSFTKHADVLQTHDELSVFSPPISTPLINRTTDNQQQPTPDTLILAEAAADRVADTALPSSSSFYVSSALTSTVSTDAESIAAAEDYHHKAERENEESRNGKLTHRNRRQSRHKHARHREDSDQEGSRRVRNRPSSLSTTGSDSQPLASDVGRRSVATIDQEITESPVPSSSSSVQDTVPSEEQDSTLADAGVGFPSSLVTTSTVSVDCLTAPSVQRASSSTVIFEPPQLTSPNPEADLPNTFVLHVPEQIVEVPTEKHSSNDLSEAASAEAFSAAPASTSVNNVGRFNDASLSRATNNHEPPAFPPAAQPRQSTLFVEVLILGIVIVSLFITVLDPRWLLPIAPIVAYVLCVSLQSVAAGSQQLTILPSSLLSPILASISPPKSRSSPSPSPWSPSSSSAASSRSLSPSLKPRSLLPTFHSVAEHKESEESNESHSSAELEADSAASSASVDPVIHSAAHSASSNSSPSTDDSTSIELHGRARRRANRQKKKRARRVSFMKNNQQPLINTAETQHTQDQEDAAPADDDVSEQEEHKEEQIEQESQKHSDDNGAEIMASTRGGHDKQQSNHSDEAPSADNEKETHFFLPEPVADIQNAATYILTFTYRHRWQDVVAAFWDLTQPDWKQQGYTLRGLHTDIDDTDNNPAQTTKNHPLSPTHNSTMNATLYSPQPTQTSPRSSPSSSSGSSSPPSSETLDYPHHTVLNYWFQPNDQRTYIHRQMHVQLKVPTVIKKVIGPATQQICLEERCRFDPQQNELRLQCINPRMRKFVWIHETRVFTPHPEQPEQCTVLSCRFRVVLLPSCGVLQSTLYKWLSLTWKQKQQQMGEKIAQKLEQQRRQQQQQQQSVTGVDVYKQREGPRMPAVAQHHHHSAAV